LRPHERRAPSGRRIIVITVRLSGGDRQPSQGTSPVNRSDPYLEAPVTLRSWGRDSYCCHRQLWSSPLSFSSLFPHRARRGVINVPVVLLCWLRS